ncbi:unnamed protein product, partial [Allacma fusca]
NSVTSVQRFIHCRIVSILEFAVTILLLRNESLALHELLCGYIVEKIENCDVALKHSTDSTSTNPPPGVVCRQGDTLDVINADITGPPGSPFEKGTFSVEVSLSERYPFTPPNARFVTPIYHPNVDNNGRICLSGLKPKPAGSWNCSMNIAVILSAIRLLMSEPNLGDPLMADIATEYKDNLALFRTKAETETFKHAVKGAETIDNNDDDERDADLLKSDSEISRKSESNLAAEDNSSTEKISSVQIALPENSVGRSSKNVIEEIQLSSESDDECVFLSYNPRKKLKSVE